MSMWEPVQWSELPLGSMWQHPRVFPRTQHLLGSHYALTCCKTIFDWPSSKLLETLIFLRFENRVAHPVGTVAPAQLHRDTATVIINVNQSELLQKLFSWLPARAATIRATFITAIVEDRTSLENADRSALTRGEITMGAIVNCGHMCIARKDANPVNSGLLYEVPDVRALACIALPAVFLALIAVPWHRLTQNTTGNLPFVSSSSFLNQFICTSSIITRFRGSR